MRLQLFVATTVTVLTVLAGCIGGSDDTPARDASSPAASAPSDSAPGSDPPEEQRRGATTDAPPVPEPPEDRACYRLSFDELARTSDDSEPVRCRGRHNAQTFHVGQLDASVEGDPAALESKPVREQLARTCPRRMRAFLGGDRSTRALSRFQAVWFTPTAEQAAAGARWFRCDVIAFAGDERLAPLPPPRRLEGMLDDEDALEEFGLCGTAAPGARSFSRVICSRNHSWRAIAAIFLEGGKRYPGQREVRTAGEETCRDEAREIADDTLRFRYGWEWPTREQWEHGQRHGYCWAPS